MTKGNGNEDSAKASTIDDKWRRYLREAAIGDLSALAETPLEKWAPAQFAEWVAPSLPKGMDLKAAYESYYSALIDRRKSVLQSAKALAKLEKTVTSEDETPTERQPKKRAPAPKQEERSQLSPEMWRVLCERRLKEQADALDPPADIGKMLDRIEVFAHRMAQAKDNDTSESAGAFRFGLEIVAWVAHDLRMLCAPYMSARRAASSTARARYRDLERRYVEALGAVAPSGKLYALDSALVEAAMIAPAEGVQQAIELVRHRMGPRLPSLTSNSQLEAAISEYAKPRSRGGRKPKVRRHKPNAVGQKSTVETRLGHLKSILGLKSDLDSISDDLEEAAKRADDRIYEWTGRKPERMQKREAKVSKTRPKKPRGKRAP